MKKILLLLSIFLPLQLSAQIKEVRMGIEAAYPPFSELGTDGKPQGFDYDIGNALCEEMQVECVWVIQDWDGMIPGLLSNKFDAIMSSMTITQERLKRIDFTDRYYTVGAKLVAEKGSSLDANDPSTLEGTRIGVQRASSHESYAKDVLESAGTRVVTYPTQEEVFADLRNGRIDGALQDTPVARNFVMENTQFDFVGESVDSPMHYDDGIGIGIRKGEDELKNMLNEALANILANGTYKEISTKYFQDFDIYSN